MADKQKPAPQSGVKPRKIPMRQCLGCNEHRPKAELLRVLRAPDGSIGLDFTGKKSGRGAYICKSQACFEKLPRAGKRIEKAFGCKLPEELSAQLRVEFERVRERELAAANQGDAPSGAG